jgi:uncharacterized protein YgbK (DUF1537 family)
MPEKRLLKDVLEAYPGPDTTRIEAQLSRELDLNDKKIIVLDDDPTGVQTVSGVSVYTDWTYRSVLSGFQEENSLFYILTNSRAFTGEEARRINGDAAENVLRASRGTGKDFILISRSDSTLRGHYPLETQTLRDVLEAHDVRVDGEIICPFFMEGGRYTEQNIHYVRVGDVLIPAGETEFARDRTFGYRNSHLGCWIEEKSGGRYRMEDVTYISVDSLRRMDTEKICGDLLKMEGFSKAVLNSVSYDDVRVFAVAFFRALRAGKRFIFRSAAAIPKVLGGVPDRPLLTRTQLIDDGNRNGGLIVVGSHVKRTSDQLDKLLQNGCAEPVEFNQHLVVNPEKFRQEIVRVQALINQKIRSGATVAVYTRRERFDLNTGNREDELLIAKRISEALTDFVSALEAKPRFIIAKGGITSSDIGTRGLLVKRATVLGQVLPGIPVWLTGEDSRFPGMPYIIFPGNVGDSDALYTIVDLLSAQSR